MKKLRAIIVSQPGSWQRVLQTNIEDCPFVDAVEVVSGSLTASQLVEQQQPDLLLIDSSVPFEDAVALVRNLKRHTPKTKSIVIADTTQQRRQIALVGADYTLSSFNYETQIGEVLHQVNGKQPDGPLST
jgi:DNA-binding NarL/FixJ family response regulator